MEIGSRWQRISQGQKDHYKKLAEEQQKQYKVHLDIWLKVSGEPQGGVSGGGCSWGCLAQALLTAFLWEPPSLDPSFGVW